MDFTEFREKFHIDQDRLHRLTLEAFELFGATVTEAKEYQDYVDSMVKDGSDPNDFDGYSYDPKSNRDEYLYGFLRLLMDEAGE